MAKSKKVNKSELIRKLYDEGKTVKEIREKVKCSDGLVRLVIRNYKKKLKKKAQFKSPRSRLVNELFQMKKALDVVEKNPAKIKDDWENKKAFWKTMKDQYGDRAAEVMDQLVNPENIFGEVTLELDPVNHPPHYTKGGIETIDFIEAKDLNYRLGNVIKYVSRAGKKDSDPIVDLEKAAWYLQREILARKEA